MLLCVPASSAYLGVLRTATAGLAARMHFTLDEIEDLRIAVDEACAILLALTPDDSELTCRFVVLPDVLTVETSILTASNEAGLPPGESFAWQVLSALTDEVSALAVDGRATIRLTKRRPA